MSDRAEGSEYLTAAEAAKLLNFSVKTIVRWIDEGRLPCIVIEGERLLRRKDLESILLRAPEEDPEDSETES